VRDFHSLIAWQRADEVVRLTYQVTQALPDSERFGLVPQMRRAAVSIASNIAEAAGRSTQLDGARFLSVASGSASELEYQVELITRLDFADAHLELLTKIGEVQRMLISLERNWRQTRGQPPRAF
jgi:four helix bundle protein